MERILIFLYMDILVVDSLDTETTSVSLFYMTESYFCNNSQNR